MKEFGIDLDAMQARRQRLIRHCLKKLSEQQHGLAARSARLSPTACLHLSGSSPDAEPRRARHRETAAPGQTSARFGIHLDATPAARLAAARVGATVSSTSSKDSGVSRVAERDRVFRGPDPSDVGTARILAALGFESIATAQRQPRLFDRPAEGLVPDDEVLAHCRAILGRRRSPGVGENLEKIIGHSPASVIETMMLSPKNSRS